MSPVRPTDDSIAFLPLQRGAAYRCGGTNTLVRLHAEAFGDGDQPIPLRLEDFDSIREHIICCLRCEFGREPISFPYHKLNGAEGYHTVCLVVKCQDCRRVSIRKVIVHLLALCRGGPGGVAAVEVPHDELLSTARSDTARQIVV
jgi:hypothetical protein